MVLFTGFVLATAAVTDAFTARIPNALIGATLFGMIPLALIEEGIAGVGRSILLSLFFLSILICLYLIGAVRAGDCKLLSVCCGFSMTLITAFRFIFMAFVIGALEGLIVISYRVIATKKGKDEYAWRIKGGVKLPKKRTRIRFSIPILISYFIFLITGGV